MDDAKERLDATDGWSVNGEWVRAGRTTLPIFHARVLARGLLEGDVVARREGAKAAGDDGHRAELGPRRVDHVGAGGALAALPVAALQVVVGTRDGHLHGGGRCGGGRPLEGEPD